MKRKWAQEKETWDDWHDAQTGDAGAEVMDINWRAERRRPFKRGFIPYAPGQGGPDYSRARRRAIRIETIEDPAGDDNTPAPVETFEELEVLPPWLLEGIVKQGWHEPMPVQAQALPILLAGQNLIGIAQTGSGKTASFLLPAVVQIEDQPALSEDDPGPVALILAPTRELAVQIKEEALKVLTFSERSERHPEGLRAACVYGGGSRRDQIQELGSAGAHVLVGTPGRLLDMVAQGQVSLHRVTFFVLDEADRMLDLGFQDQVNGISRCVRPERQMALFSATWPTSVRTLASEMCHASGEAVRIVVGAPQQTPGGWSPAGKEEVTANPSVAQEVVVVDLPGDWDAADAQKRRILNRYVREALTADEANKVLVFVNQKSFADELSKSLWGEGFEADCLHGGRPQDTRLRVLEQFRKGEIRLLVATDVLGRGIDIPGISHVVVYDMGEIEDYVHRIGRTARGTDTVGHALVFFEYYPGAPECAERLIGILEKAKQTVPNTLRRIAKEVSEGKREVRA